MKLRSVATAMVAAAFVVPSAAAPAQAQGTYYGSLNRDEVLHCITGHWSDCGNAQDAARWSLDVTMWRFGEQGHNNMADAFRHCTWTGAMAQRMGSDTAAGIAARHELNEGQPDSERAMDDANNIVGNGVGQQSNYAGTDDTWGWILARCEKHARAHMLFGLDGVRGNY